MEDILGKVVSIIFGCVLMFIVPIMLIAQKQDTIAQSYMDNATVEFVDNARTSGKITPEAYEQLCNSIDAAHMICEIKITHSSSYTIPSDDVDANGVYKTTTYRYDRNKQDILDAMYANRESNDYPMKNGDYLKVEVKNISPTFGTRMLRFFTLDTQDVTLFTSYGGFVGNNIQ